MELIISKTSSKPIYEQLKEQIKTLIMKNELQSGDILPSVRSLAKSLEISVITAQRAYQDLQAEGFIETSSGKGTYVSSNTNKDFIREERFKEIEVLLVEAWKIALENNIEVKQLIKLLEIFDEEE